MINYCNATACCHLYGHEVGKGLQGVVQVREGVDHRHAGLRFQLLHIHVFVHARQQEAVEPRKDLCTVQCQTSNVKHPAGGGGRREEREGGEGGRGGLRRSDLAVGVELVGR